MCEKIVWVKENNEKILMEKEDIKAVEFTDKGYILKTSYGDMKIETELDPYEDLGYILQTFDVTCDDIAMYELKGCCSWEVCRVENILDENQTF